MEQRADTGFSWKQQSNTYHVWRRSDGHVGVSAYDPNKHQYPNHTFEVLLVTQDWPTAEQRVRDERG